MSVNASVSGSPRAAMSPRVLPLIARADRAKDQGLPDWIELTMIAGQLYHRI